MLPNSPRDDRLEPPTVDDRLIWDIRLSRWHSPAMTVADEIGLFSLLAESPLPAEAVRRRLALGARGAEALLAVLTALGLLVQHRGRCTLTDTARVYLLPDSPFYYGPMLLGARESEAHTTLHEALRRDVARERETETASAPTAAPPDRGATGTAKAGEAAGSAKTAGAPGAAKGSPVDNRVVQGWAAGEIDPERARRVTAAMHSHSLPAALGVARHGDFGGVTRLLDVAGGSGCFPIALALRHPQLRCTVMELPAVCAVADEYIRRFGAEGQVDTLAANMFADAWPAGYDAVFFSNIFHDWDRERCAFLARRSYEVLPPGGRIYLHEMLLEETRDGPLATACFSISMLVATEGKQYTAAELEALLTEAGFRDVTVTPTYAYYSLVSATRR